ncbi:MAG: phosphoglycerate mutase [Chitinivibrionales bacterium]|nr:phosphoglycerate mutase [Chitinivibrionales bacterium]
MSRFLLIRHCEADHIGNFVAGRMDGVHLNGKGRKQADALAERLRQVPMDAIITSPLERAFESAELLAESKRIFLQKNDALSEMDFGRWTGCEFEALKDEPQWKIFNSFRSGALVPGGESILQVQCRMVSTILEINTEKPDSTIALVSHADPIKTALIYFLGVPIDCMLRMTISPASVSVLDIGENGAVVQCINDVDGRLSVD